MASARKPNRGKEARLRRRKQRLRRAGGAKIVWVSLASLVGLSLLSFVGWTIWGTGQGQGERLELGLRIAKQGDYATAASLAQSIAPESLERKSEISTRHYLIGANAYCIGQSLQHRPSRMQKAALAAEHLEKSAALRFPAGYEGIGNYYLGRALFELFRWQDARAPLAVAAERWPQGRSDAMECLIDIDLYGDTPDLASAEQRLERWQALASRSHEDQDRISLKRMELAAAGEEWAEVPQWWKAIERDSPYRPSANLILARCLRRQADSDTVADPEALRGEALRHLEENAVIDRVPTTIRRRSQLEQGILYRLGGRISEAVSILSSLRLSSPFEPEFMMAGIEEIDSLIDQSNFLETTETLNQLQKHFVDRIWYENAWMPLAEMRRRLLASAARLLTANAYEAADKFVESLPSLCDEVDRLRLTFTLHDAWARRKLAEGGARDANPARHPGVKHDAVEQSFRRAAQALERLCQLDMRAPDTMSLLWLGIEDYHLANDFLGSNRMIQRYLAFAPRNDQAKALLMQARNLSASEEPQRALQVIDQILLAHAQSPVAPEAKLLAARLHWGQGEFQEAERLISENLYSGVLRPDSETWKESLLELGTLMYRQGEQMQVRALGAAVEPAGVAQESLKEIELGYRQLTRSIESMEEGLRRFQSDPRRYQLLYMTAKAYRMASFWPETLLQGDRLVSDDSIAQWRGKRKELLVRSREFYATLRREITSDSGAGDRIPNAEILLRNSFFGEADLLFYEGNFSAAIDAYRSAANRFIHEPESLEAFVQIARCQDELGQLEESRRTLEMALDILSRIPTDRDERFQTNTRHSRADWNGQLRWMLDELERKQIR